MIKNKCFHTLLAIFICFSAPCFSAELPRIAQEEERWRWRESLDIYIHSGHNYYGPVPAQRIHADMGKQEEHLTRFLNKTYASTTNIVVASITVVVQTANNALASITDWIRAPSDPAQILFFPSTATATLRNGAQTGVQYMAATSPDNEDLKGYLNGELLASIPDHNFLPNGNYDALVTAINTPVTVTFSTAIQHSEQKLMYYLSQDEGAGNNFMLNVQRILTTAGWPEQPARIRAIVLHVHSNRDPCNNCGKTLSFFPHYITNNIYNVPTFLTVSSRKTYDSSRSTKSHDTNYRGHIIMDIPALANGLTDLPVAHADNVHTINLATMPIIPVLPQIPAANFIMPPPHPNPDLAIAPADLPVVYPAAPYPLRHFRTILPDVPVLQRYISSLPG